MKNKRDQKIHSRRILKKNIKRQIDNVLVNICLESYNKRSPLIYRQLIRFLDQKHYSINFVDNCSSKNLIEFCNGKDIKKLIKNIPLTYNPVNQDIVRILDDSVCGWYSPNHKEIVITGNPLEIKTTLIHEFSHFLYNYKFEEQDFDFIDDVNNEFESYFQELFLDVRDNLISEKYISVNNIKNIRTKFEAKYGETILDLYIYHLEKLLEDLFTTNIDLRKYFEENESKSFSFHQIFINYLKGTYNYCFGNYNLNKEKVEKVEKGLEYYQKIINKFSNDFLKNNMNNYLELACQLKDKYSNL